MIWRCVMMSSTGSVQEILQHGMAMLGQNGFWVELYAFDANYLLDGRIVAYNAGSSQATGSDIAIDNVMKRVARENLTTAAIAARDIEGT